MSTLKVRQRDAHRLEHRLPVFFISFLIEDGELRELLLERRRNRNQLADRHTGRCAVARHQLHREIRRFPLFLFRLVLFFLFLLLFFFLLLLFLRLPSRQRRVFIHRRNRKLDRRSLAQLPLRCRPGGQSQRVRCRRGSFRAIPPEKHAVVVAVAFPPRNAPFMPPRQILSCNAAARRRGCGEVCILAERSQRHIRGILVSAYVKSVRQPRAPHSPILKQRKVLAPVAQRCFQERGDVRLRNPPLLVPRHQRLQIQTPAQRFACVRPPPHAVELPLIRAVRIDFRFKPRSWLRNLHMLPLPPPQKEIGRAHV